MAPPQDLASQFNRLVQMISKDMKNVGDQIGQIVAKINQQETRIAKMEKEHAALMGSVQQAMNGGAIHGNTKVVNGQVMPPPEVEGVAPSTVWTGNPNAFYEGGEDT